MKRKQTSNTAISQDIAIQNRLQAVCKALRQHNTGKAEYKRLERERRELSKQLNALYN